MEKTSFGSLRSYSFAILAVSLTLLLTPLVAPPVRPVAFLAAVAATAWYVSFAQGLLAAAASALLIRYFSMSPVNSLSLDSAQAVRLGAFLLVSYLLSSYVSARRRAETAMRSAAQWNRLLVDSAHE